MTNEIMPLLPQEDKTDMQPQPKNRKKYFSEWREKNREKIRNNWNEKNIEIECECGLTIKKYNKVNHLKTQRHTLLMKTINIKEQNA